MNIYWLSLFFAGVLEIVGAFSMKQSAGFTKLMPSIITIITMIGSFFLLSFSMKNIPLSTAYVIWTGIGAIGSFIVGIYLLGDSVNSIKIIAAIFILIGIILMKASS